MHRTGYGRDDLRVVDGQENACPPVAYISDLIRVSSHGFQLAEKVMTSPDRTMNNEQTDRYTKTKNTKHKLRASHGPKLPPGKKNTITAALQSGAFSPFPPGSNCLFSSVVVLSLGFAGVAAVPARVPTCSVGEEMSPPWFDPMPTSK